MMRISLRDPKGVEIDHAIINDRNDAVYSAMRILARWPGLEVGSLLTVDGDNVPTMGDPKIDPVITVANLVALAGRLEARAGMMGDSQPGNAADLRITAKFMRHAVRVGWVFTSVSLVV